MWVWMAANSKVFLVKSAYDLLLTQSQTITSNSDLGQVFKNLWSCSTPRKVLAFSWQLVLDRLPTRSNLFRRSVITDPNQTYCVLCGSSEESTKHLFLDCLFQVQVWQHVHRWLGSPFTLPTDIVSLYTQHRGIFRGKKGRKYWQVIWHAMVLSI